MIFASSRPMATMYLSQLPTFDFTTHWEHTFPLATTSTMPCCPIHLKKERSLQPTSFRIKLIPSKKIHSPTGNPNHPVCGPYETSSFAITCELFKNLQKVARVRDLFLPMLVAHFLGSLSFNGFQSPQQSHPSLHECPVFTKSFRYLKMEESWTL